MPKKKNATPHVTEGVKRKVARLALWLQAFANTGDSGTRLPLADVLRWDLDGGWDQVARDIERADLSVEYVAKVVQELTHLRAIARLHRRGALSLVRRCAPELLKSGVERGEHPSASR